MNKIALLLSITSGVSFFGYAAEKGKTNFIVIFCDDLGYGDLSCYGHPTIKTPNLDKLASEGQKWSSFYTSASVSSPSRAGLLTGRLGARTGMYGDKKRVLYPESENGLPTDEQTIATYLKTAGYTTACVGKWHLGIKKDNMPLNHGFDYYYGIPFSNDMSRKEQNKMGNGNYTHELPFYNQEEVVELDPDQTEFTQRLTKYAIEFIKNKKDEPFFLYLSHPMPHVPLYASSSFQNTSARGAYGDVVQEIDWSVGQVIEALEKHGLDENTVVLFSSDNGPWLSYNQDGGSAGLLANGKGSTYEGGFRVPAIFWGADIKHDIITQMGSTLDILPTFCEYANIIPNESKILDGSTLRGVLNGEEKDSPREVFYFYIGTKVHAIRKGSYKMHVMNQNKKIKLETPLLYNLDIDPSEKQNIASKHPNIIKELTYMLDKHLNSFDKAKPLFD